MKPNEALTPLLVVALILAVPVSLMTIYSIICGILSLFGVYLPR